MIRKMAGPMLPHPSKSLCRLVVGRAAVELDTRAGEVGLRSGEPCGLATTGGVALRRLGLTTASPQFFIAGLAGA